MNYKEFLYDKDKVLSFYPELAVIFNKYDDMEIERIKKKEEEAERKGIVLEKKEKKPDKNGLGKAIVINQLNYWINLNEKTNHNYRDGYYWVYFSYNKWVEEDFPFWSAKTLQRILTSLENSGVVISTKEYNKLKIDNTKWYRLNYSKLQEIIDLVSNVGTSGQFVQTIETECPDQRDNLTRPIPEITNIDYYTENIITPTELNSFSKEKANTPTGLNSSKQKQTSSSNKETDNWAITKNHITTCMKSHRNDENSKKTESIIKIIKYYYWKYNSFLDKPHPRLNDKTMKFVISQFLKGFNGRGYDHDYETYTDMIDLHFKTRYRNCIDWNIQHFMDGNIREVLFMKLYE